MKLQMQFKKKAGPGWPDPAGIWKRTAGSGIPGPAVFLEADPEGYREGHDAGVILDR